MTLDGAFQFNFKNVFCSTAPPHHWNLNKIRICFVSIKGRLAGTWKRSSILADAKLFWKKSSRRKFNENKAQRNDSKVMIHVIFYNTDFKSSLIIPRSRVWCVRITDDVMSDDVIIDYIITKNEEMTLLVFVSPFRGWTLGQFWSL